MFWLLVPLPSHFSGALDVDRRAGRVDQERQDLVAGIGHRDAGVDVLVMALHDEVVRELLAVASSSGSYRR